MTQSTTSAPSSTTETCPEGTLAKAFDPIAIESHWYPLWEKAGYFKESNDTNKPAYCIQLPPPNVTGTLHMGWWQLDAVRRFAGVG